MTSIAVCDDNIDFIENELKPCLDLVAQSMNSSFSVEYYTDGHEIIRLFERGQIPDILILDIEMPSINGKDLARKLRAIDRSFSLVFLSTYTHEVFDTIKYQIDAFIPKSNNYKSYVDEFCRVIRDQSRKKDKFAVIDVLISGELSTMKISVGNILGFYMANRSIYMKTLTDEIVLKETIFDKIKRSFLSKGFVESSRNYIINIKRVSEIKQDSVIFDNGDTFPVSRRKAKSLITALNRSILEEMTF